MRKKLPVGIEDFEKIRREGFYYVDKTGLIRSLLSEWAEVTLFTRPRRFGKSLNMSMLRTFFEIGHDKSLFEGLKIAEETELCQQYMGKFPVVSITLRGVGMDSYEVSRDMIVRIINREASRLQYLEESDRLTDRDKERFRVLFRRDMDEADLCGSLYTMSSLLQKHYGERTIILIDEYDVPLAKANEKGYHDRMVTLIRGMFEQTLKTNESLQFAVLTGCLRVAKESIFTGLNNLKVLSVTSTRSDEYFGFTDDEVREMLDYYGIGDAYGLVKKWYDGYHFGKVDVYCPWDVICYCDEKIHDPDLMPKDYWINTSSNDLIRRFLEMARPVTRREIERLIAGETVVKTIREDLTYKELYHSIENIWSVLFTTGYLTQRGKPEGRALRLAIPNEEIRNIFVEQIMEWIQDTARKDGAFLDAFCEAFRQKDVAKIQESFTRYLNDTISVRDTAVRHPMKEDFYHGILLGLLSYKDTWYVASNRESGDGYSDIQVEIYDEKIGMAIEVKYAPDGDLDAGCRQAMEQIEAKRYASQLRADGMQTILRYAVACHIKECRVELIEDDAKMTDPQ